MEKDKEILSEITVFMKYSKYIPELKRRENWTELITRNQDMHIKKFPNIAQEIKEVYKRSVFPKKVLPSMRSLQFAGPAMEVNSCRIFNCCYQPIDDYRAFSEGMFLLLSGCGYGYSVQKHHIDKLPEINKPAKNRRYLIADSIHGWADAIKVLINSYFTGKAKPVFDFRDIRLKGARLITSGGKAPGPEPLKRCLFEIEQILNNKINGDKLKTIEAHSIMCHIADSVLAGGIRRSAMIAMFTMDDDDMLSCKSGNWWELNPHYARANNSATIVTSRITEEEFNNLWIRIQASGAGEPGIYFTNDPEYATNPCCETSLRSHSFCVSANTSLITRDGIENIKKCVDKEVEIWNGEQWSIVTPFQTGSADQLHRVFFNDGSYLDATDNHKFLVKNRFDNKYKELETLELIEALKISKYKLSIPRANIIYNENEGTDERNAYEYGFVLGDGTVSKNNIYADLYEKSFELELEGSYNKKGKNYRGTDNQRINFNKILNLELTKEMKYTNGLPKNIFSWNRKSILNFIGGWADADGSQQGRGIRIYGQESKIRDGQLLLTKCGINSSVNLMSKKGEQTNLCIRKNDVWYLQISAPLGIKSKRLNCSNYLKSDKNLNQVISKIETLEGVHESFCLTEDKLHQCVFNNVLTKQCNLTEINGDDIIDQEDFNQRSKDAAFINTLQASYTDFYYLREIWKRNTEKDALIGVGITGIGSGSLDNLNKGEAAKIIKEENERVAKIIGINKAARCTVVKPAGTTSLVLGTSSGIHAYHDEYYIRRLRVGKNESIYTHLAIHNPELLEDEVFRPNDTAVISIPQKAPKTAHLRTESALALLERTKEYNLEWIRKGHRRGPNYHNVSATISVKEDEWKEVGNWMWKNKNSYHGLSILPYTDHTYKQAPFESCSELEYNSLFNSIEHIDLMKVIEMEDNVQFADQIACGGLGCEVA